MCVCALNKKEMHTGLEHDGVKKRKLLFLSDLCLYGHYFYRCNYFNVLLLFKKLEKFSPILVYAR